MDRSKLSSILENSRFRLEDFSARAITDTTKHGSSNSSASLREAKSILKRTELLQFQRELRISKKTPENPNPSHFWEKNLAYMKDYT